MSEGPRELEDASGSGAGLAADPVPVFTSQQVSATETERPRIGPFYALRYRNFRLFFIGQVISVAGTWMQTVAQQWLVWSLTHDARWLGIVSGASAIPSVLFAAAGGSAADRHSRRAILVWTQTAWMLLAFVLWFLVAGKWIHAWHVAVIAALMGGVNAFNTPAQQAFVTDMIEERHALGNAIGLSSLRFNLSRFLGPMLAGWMLHKYGTAACFFWNGVSFIAVIISLLMMRLPRFVPRNGRLAMREGLVFIRRNRRVLRTVMLIGAASVFAWSISTLYPVYATGFHRGAGGYSLLMTLNGIGAAVGGLWAATFAGRLKRRMQIYGGGAIFAVALLALALSPGFGIALGCLVVAGFAMILFAINSNTSVQEEVPDELRGRVMAVYGLVFQGLMPIGGLEIGFLAKYVHARAATEANALIFLVILISFYVWSQRDRASRKPDAPAPSR
jgi:MFS family permease